MEADRWFRTEVLPIGGHLYRFLQKRCRSASDAEDYVQEVYARAYASYLRKAPGQNRAFLFTIARNLLIDEARRRKGAKPVEDFNLMEVRDTAPCAEETLVAQQIRQAVIDTILQLPVRCREAIILRKIYGLPQRQVAHQMGITEDTVERHVLNGMRILTDQIGASSSLPEGFRIGTPRGVILDPDEKEALRLARCFD